MSDSASAPATDLYDLVWFPSPDWRADLASIARPENWDDEGNDRLPILFNYFRYYARRVHEEGKWIESTSRSGSTVSAFDTGLLSKHFEPIYAVFEENRDPNRQRWVHREWATPSSPRLRDFDLEQLTRAVFFSNPAEVVYDPRLPIVANVEHIVDDNADRYPEALRDNDYLRKAALDHAIKVAGAKARSNWRIAVPQYYWPHGEGAGRIQLLIPLSLTDPDQVDLALVLDRSPAIIDESSIENACYRAYTVLPLDWAYRNARLITRPDSYWLDMNTRAEAGADAAADDDGQGGWRAARGHDRCPLCDAVSGCLIRADNREVACRNVDGGRPFTSRSGSTVWMHQLDFGSTAIEPSAPSTLRGETV